MRSSQKRSAAQVLYYLSTLLVVSALLVTTYGAIWEWSTRSYLNGFANAIVPFHASPQQKAEAILAWMAHGPDRDTLQPQDVSSFRDPEVTLNSKSLLVVCGTATNAFVNVAYSSGLEARRLLLLDSKGEAKHVVVEVYIDGRWVVADPAFRVFLKDAAGHLLTKRDLANVATLRAATSEIPSYDPNYTYERTGYIRLGAIPGVGKLLQRGLDSRFHAFDELFNGTLLVERQSYFALVLGLGLLTVSLGAREILKSIAKKHLGMVLIPLRERLMHRTDGRLAVFGAPIRVSPWR